MIKTVTLFAIFAFAVAKQNGFVSQFEMEPDETINMEHEGPARTEFDAVVEFQKFKDRFSKMYESSEKELERFHIFKENLNAIKKHNTLYNSGNTSFSYGINQFSDMTIEEIRKEKICREITGPICMREEQRHIHVPVPEKISYARCVTPAADQGECKSCWAFSATGAMESQYCLKHRQSKPYRLSVQQLIDCDNISRGCDGGSPDNAFHSIKNIGGLQAAVDYRYEARKRSCRFNPELTKVKTTGCRDIWPRTEDALKVAVAEHGPLSIAIDTTHESFYRYDCGVYYEQNCSNKREDLNHAALLYGYGTEKGKDFWLVRNSWGPGWGEHGTIKMARNRNNQCGIATMASYPLVE